MSMSVFIPKPSYFDENDYYHASKTNILACNDLSKELNEAIKDQDIYYKFLELKVDDFDLLVGYN